MQNENCREWLAIHTSIYLPSTFAPRVQAKQFAPVFQGRFCAGGPTPAHRDRGEPASNLINFALSGPPGTPNPGGLQGLSDLVQRALVSPSPITRIL